jgi:hypothetical protein
MKLRKFRNKTKMRSTEWVFKMEKQRIECGETLISPNRKYDFLCDLCWFDWGLKQDETE